MSDHIHATGLACLSLKGADALTFLQGQLSCDVRPLACKEGVGGISLGARLNLKGRVVASCYVLGVEDGFLLLLPASQADALYADLKKYVLFSKAKLQQESWQVLAQATDAVAAGAVVQQGAAVLARLPHLPLALCVSPDAAAPADPSVFVAAEINAGIAQIVPETAGVWLPQELGYDELGAVSYNKGCYLGQEIVARLHFKGEVKQHLFRLELAAAERLPEPVTGAEVTLADGKSVGQLVQVIRQDQRLLALAVLRDQLTSEPMWVAGGWQVASCVPVVAP